MQAFGHGAQAALAASGLFKEKSLLELTTGLTIEDVEALKANPSDDLRAAIAVKFGRQFDRLSQGKAQGTSLAILDRLTKDRAKAVRLALAHTVAASSFLPEVIACRLIRDEIEIAWPVLEQSPVLPDSALIDAIRTRPPPYAFAIAGRQPLASVVADVLVVHEAVDVVGRLVDNHEASLSAAAIDRVLELCQSDSDLEQRLARRPDLPYAVVERFVSRLGAELGWAPVSTRHMAKAEAQRMAAAVTGRAIERISSTSRRMTTLRRSLDQRFAAGDLRPTDILALLRDCEIDQAECGLAVLAGIEIREVRKLLYGIDKRGLVALCVRAGFTAPQYLALRVAIGLMEQGDREDVGQLHYQSETMAYAQAQFERMLANPDLLKPWFPAR
jgi:uncharacterized protein (DUF2336 family)